MSTRTYNAFAHKADGDDAQPSCDLDDYQSVIRLPTTNQQPEKIAFSHVSRMQFNGRVSDERYAEIKVNQASKVRTVSNVNPPTSTTNSTTTRINVSFHPPPPPTPRCRNPS